MTTDTIRDTALQQQVLGSLADFVAKTVPSAAGTPIVADTPLLGSGLLDSLAILQLVMFLGEEFGVEVGDDDFTEENFATAGSLARFVVGKRAGAA